MMPGDDSIALIEPQTAIEAFGREGTVNLWTFMHQRNGPHEYIMGFRDERDRIVYAAAVNLTARSAINKGVDSITGDLPPERALAFAPYPRDAHGNTCWGALDFDAHDGDDERARRFAIAATQCAQAPGRHVILEETGSGYHVFILKQTSAPCSAWVQLLAGIAEQIGAPLAAGVCEIFPSGA